MLTHRSPDTHILSKVLSSSVALDASNEITLSSLSLHIVIQILEWKPTLDPRNLVQLCTG